MDMFIGIISFLGILMIPSIPARIIKKLVIKKMLLRQEESIKSRIPNMLLVAKHVDFEDSYSLMAAFSSSFIYLFALVELFSDDGIHWVGFGVLFLVGTTFSYLIDAIVFYIRRTAGFIQGAVLFDPKEKRIYAFPSITSVYYNEYHESQLIYTTESYIKHDTAYVFFTKKENEFAFKVDNLQYNNFEAILSQKEPADMSIPYKYQFHEIAAILIGVIGAFVIGIPELLCVMSILKSCNLNLF